METISMAAGRQRKRGFSHGKKHLPGIDMTPMVDLGFLLITFFIFTATLSQPSVMHLIMQDDDTILKKPNNLAESLSLSVLLDENNKIFYYHGRWEQAVNENAIYETGYSYSNGIGEIIRKKQKDIDASGKFQNGRKEMMLLIKPGEKATYQNVMDALDEVMINDVKKYAIVNLQMQEKEYLSTRNK